MTNEPTKNQENADTTPTYAELIKAGGEFDTRLKATRSAAWEDSSRQLHEQLGRDLASLQRNQTSRSFEPPSEDAVLRLCLAARAKARNTSLALRGCTARVPTTAGRL